MERFTRATLRETREHNGRLVLATIYDDLVAGPLAVTQAPR